MFFIGNKLINKCLVEYKLFRIMIKDCRKICPVCGYDDLDEGPFTEGGYPTYEICPCCGYEFGYDDEAAGFSYTAFREKWIAGGFRWFTEEEQPNNWDRPMMEKQLSNVKLSKAKSRYVAKIDNI